MALKNSPNKTARRAGPKRATQRPGPNSKRPAPKTARPSSTGTEANRTRATQLYLAGNPPPAIASQLGIPERSARRHVERTRKDFVADHRAERDTMMVRAIESQRALAAVAMAAYEEARDRERAILTGQHDYVKRRIVRRGRPRRDTQPDDPDAWDADPGDPGGDLVEEIERPRLPNQCARFLTIAFNAHREVAKLQGLYTPQAQQAPGQEHLLLTDDIDPETGEPIIVPFNAKYPLDAPDHADDTYATETSATDTSATDDENAGAPQNPATNGHPAGAEMPAPAASATPTCGENAPPPPG